MVQPLERRVLLSTFTVTTAADSGDGSLRQAIELNDATPGPNTINFVIPGTGVHTIALLSPLPTATGRVTIDGTSQTGVRRAPTFADGDLNHDGRIDFDDLKMLARAFGHRIVQPT